MGKERPSLLRLRVRGTKSSVEALMDKLQPMLVDMMMNSEQVSHWRVGRNLRVSGTEHVKKEPQYEWHFMVPADAMAKLLIEKSKDLQLDKTTDGEGQV